MTTDNHSVLILGATSDIARALARRYGAQGRPLILAARDPAALTRDAEDLRLRYRVTVQTLAFDVLDTAAQSSFIDTLPTLPQTVICAVGLLGVQSDSEQDAALAETVMRTNFTAPALFLDQIAARMEIRKSGAIIGISSVAGDRGRASNYHYGAAKAGFTAYLSGLRNRLARRDVHVLTVKPGFVRTRMTEGLKLPSFLTATPDQVARAIVRAEAGGRNIIYVKRDWFWIMLVIRHIPEFIFKYLRL